ncbi:MAG TPA: hypothetical protein V6C89_11090 [Drouetiella sp.]
MSRVAPDDTEVPESKRLEKEWQSDSLFDACFGRVISISRCSLSLSPKELELLTSIPRERLLALETGRASATLSELDILSTAFQTRPSMLFLVTEKLMQKWSPE